MDELTLIERFAKWDSGISSFTSLSLTACCFTADSSLHLDALRLCRVTDYQLIEWQIRHGIKSTRRTNVLQSRWQCRSETSARYYVTLAASPRAVESYLWRLWHIRLFVAIIGGTIVIDQIIS